jgi:hypothetical protein
MGQVINIGKEGWTAISKKRKEAKDRGGGRKKRKEGGEEVESLEKHVTKGLL